MSATAAVPAHRRFCRWRDRGVWASLPETLIDDPDFEWLMIDASYSKAHPLVRSKSVLIIGGGAGGSVLAEVLVRSGVQDVTIMDHDLL